MLGTTRVGPPRPPGKRSSVTAGTSRGRGATSGQSNTASGTSRRTRSVSSDSKPAPKGKRGAAARHSAANNVPLAPSAAGGGAPPVQPPPLGTIAINPANAMQMVTMTQSVSMSGGSSQLSQMDSGLFAPGPQQQHPAAAPTTGTNPLSPHTESLQHQHQHPSVMINIVDFGDTTSPGNIGTDNNPVKNKLGSPDNTSGGVSPTSAVLSPRLLQPSSASTITVTGSVSATTGGGGAASTVSSYSGLAPITLSNTNMPSSSYQSSSLGVPSASNNLRTLSGISTISSVGSSSANLGGHNKRDGREKSVNHSSSGHSKRRQNKNMFPTTVTMEDVAEFSTLGGVGGSASGMGSAKRSNGSSASMQDAGSGSTLSKLRSSLLLKRDAPTSANTEQPTTASSINVPPPPIDTTTPRASNLGGTLKGASDDGGSSLGASPAVVPPALSPSNAAGGGHLRRKKSIMRTPRNDLSHTLSPSGGGLGVARQKSIRGRTKRGAVNASGLGGTSGGAGGQGLSTKQRQQQQLALEKQQRINREWRILCRILIAVKRFKKPLPRMRRFAKQQQDRQIAAFVMQCWWRRRRQLRRLALRHACHLIEKAFKTKLEAAVEHKKNQVRLIQRVCRGYSHNKSTPSTTSEAPLPAGAILQVAPHTTITSSAHTQTVLTVTAASLSSFSASSSSSVATTSTSTNLLNAWSCHGRLQVAAMMWERRILGMKCIVRRRMQCMVALKLRQRLLLAFDERGALQMQAASTMHRLLREERAEFHALWTSRTNVVVIAERFKQMEKDKAAAEEKARLEAEEVATKAEEERRKQAQAHPRLSSIFAVRGSMSQGTSPVAAQSTTQNFAGGSLSTISVGPPSVEATPRPAPVGVHSDQLAAVVAAGTTIIPTALAGALANNTQEKCKSSPTEDLTSGTEMSKPQGMMLGLDAQYDGGASSRSCTASTAAPSPTNAKGGTCLFSQTNTVSNGSTGATTPMHSAHPTSNAESHSSPPLCAEEFAALVRELFMPKPLNILSEEDVSRVRVAVRVKHEELRNARAARSSANAAKATHHSSPTTSVASPHRNNVDVEKFASGWFAPEQNNAEREATPDPNDNDQAQMNSSGNNASGHPLVVNDAEGECSNLQGDGGVPAGTSPSASSPDPPPSRHREPSKNTISIVEGAMHSISAYSGDGDVRPSNMMAAMVQRVPSVTESTVLTQRGASVEPSTGGATTRSDFTLTSENELHTVNNSNRTTTTTTHTTDCSPLLTSSGSATTRHNKPTFSQGNNSSTSQTTPLPAPRHQVNGRDSPQEQDTAETSVSPRNVLDEQGNWHSATATKPSFTLSRETSAVMGMATAPTARSAHATRGAPLHPDASSTTLHDLSAGLESVDETVAQTQHRHKVEFETEAESTEIQPEVPAPDADDGKEQPLEGVQASPEPHSMDGDSVVVLARSSSEVSSIFLSPLNNEKKDTTAVDATYAQQTTGAATSSVLSQNPLYGSQQQSSSSEATTQSQSYPSPVPQGQSTAVVTGSMMSEGSFSGSNSSQQPVKRRSPATSFVDGGTPLGSARGVLSPNSTTLLVPQTSVTHTKSGSGTGGLNSPNGSGLESSFAEDDSGSTTISLSQTSPTHDALAGSDGQGLAKSGLKRKKSRKKSMRRSFRKSPKNTNLDQSGDAAPQQQQALLHLDDPEMEVAAAFGELIERTESIERKMLQYELEEGLKTIRENMAWFLCVAEARENIHPIFIDTLEQMRPTWVLEKFLKLLLQEEESRVTIIEAYEATPLIFLNRPLLANKRIGSPRMTTGGRLGPSTPAQLAQLRNKAGRHSGAGGFERGSQKTPSKKDLHGGGGVQHHSGSSKGVRFEFLEPRAPANNQGRTAAAMTSTSTVGPIRGMKNHHQRQKHHQQDEESLPVITTTTTEDELDTNNKGNTKRADNVDPPSFTFQLEKHMSSSSRQQRGPRGRGEQQQQHLGNSDGEKTPATRSSPSVSPRNSPRHDGGLPDFKKFNALVAEPSAFGERQLSVMSDSPSSFNEDETHGSHNASFGDQASRLHAGGGRAPVHVNRDDLYNDDPDDDEALQRYLNERSARRRSTTLPAPLHFDEDINPMSGKLMASAPTRPAGHPPQSKSHSWKTNNSSNSSSTSGNMRSLTGSGHQHQGGGGAARRASKFSLAHVTDGFHQMKQRRGTIQQGSFHVFGSFDAHDGDGSGGGGGDVVTTSSTGAAIVQPRSSGPFTGSDFYKVEHQIIVSNPSFNLGAATARTASKNSLSGGSSVPPPSGGAPGPLSSSATMGSGDFGGSPTSGEAGSFGNFVFGSTPNTSSQFPHPPYETTEVGPLAGEGSSGNFMSQSSNDSFTQRRGTGGSSANKRLSIAQAQALFPTARQLQQQRAMMEALRSPNPESLLSGSSGRDRSHRQGSTGSFDMTSILNLRESGGSASQLMLLSTDSRHRLGSLSSTGGVSPPTLPLGLPPGRRHSSISDQDTRSRSGSHQVLAGDGSSTTLLPVAPGSGGGTAPGSREQSPHTSRTVSPVRMPMLPVFHEFQAEGGKARPQPVEGLAKPQAVAVENTEGMP